MVLKIIFCQVFFACNSIDNNYIVVATHPINSSVYRAGSYLLGLWVAPALSTKLFVMEKTNWSIIDWNSESFLFTYSEEERQNNEINKANASLVFSPKYIILHTELLDYLSLIEATLFWFIEYYLWSEKWKRFYFTNKQLADVIRCSERTISEWITKMQKLWYITTSRKVKAGWWQIRFINSTTLTPEKHLAKFASLTSKKVPTNVLSNINIINKNIHITANADDDVFLFLSKSYKCRLSSKKEVTAVFWKYKTFEEIRVLVAIAKEWSIKYNRTDHPTIRALKWLDLYLKDNNGVKDRMDDNFEEDYDSRSNREEQLYYCRGNAQPHY